MIVLAYIFGVIACFKQLADKNAAQKLGGNIKDSNSAIYFDKTKEKEDKDNEGKGLFARCCKKLKKLNPEAKVDHFPDFDLKYQQLEELYENFKDAVATLKDQLKTEDDAADEKDLFNTSQEQQVFADEDALIDELDDLKEFLSGHKLAIHDKLGIEDFLPDEDSDEDESKSDSGDHKKSQNKEVLEIFSKAQDKEVEIQKKLEQNLEEDQQQVFDNEMEKNENMKKDLVNEFKAKMANQSLTEKEREALMQEMQSKLSLMDQMMADEKENQKRALADALAKRKKKKAQLTKVVEELHNQKDKEDDKYEKAILLINEKEQDELSQVEKDLEREKQVALRNLEVDLKKMRGDKLAETEAKLEDFKKKKQTADNEIEFGNLLTEYGNLCKSVDT